MKKELTITSCQAANTFGVMAEIGHYLAAKLEQKWTIALRYISVDESDVGGWERAYAMAAAGEIDISWVCAATYAQLMHKPTRQVDLLAVPQFSHKAYQNQPVYFSYLLVRADSPYQEFADLRGATFTYNETVSLSGHHTVCAHLHSMGIEEGYFGSALISGGHVKSIQMLADGRADCAAIDSSVWHWYQSERPDICEQLRSVHLLDSYAAPPWIISHHVPQELAEEIRTLLLDLQQTHEGRELLRQGGMSAFCLLNQQHYASTLRAVSMGQTIPLVYTA